MKVTDLHTTEERISFLKKSVSRFNERAQTHDEAATVPSENFSELRAIGYPALTVRKKYGGIGISLLEMIQMQEIIAQQDGSTALSIGWHMGITKHLGETNSWSESTYARFAEDVIKNGALINNLATEPATGSPTRGGKPETFVTKIASGWKLNGRKSFATLSPLLDYFVVSATIDGTEEVANFLVKSNLPGVSIEETWDSIAMRGTGSHDVVFEDVTLEPEDLVQYVKPGQKRAQGWLLHIPACYLGIAKAAQKYTIDFANSYSPSSIKGTISQFPAVKQKIGEMELKVLESSHFLYAVAKKWDDSDDTVRQTMQAELGAVIVSVVNKAIEIVDLAMRIVGARSLSATCPLQRYYRDVRAGLHNPPMDDMVISMLAAIWINQN